MVMQKPRQGARGLALRLSDHEHSLCAWQGSAEQKISFISTLIILDAHQNELHI